MFRALLGVVAAGAVIGLALPTAKSPEPVAAAVTGGEARETVLQRERNGHFYVHAKVNGELVRFLVDTGATGVALTVEDAKRVGLNFSNGEFEHVGQGAAGPIRGKLVMLDDVEVDGKKVSNVSGAILDGAHISLLGQSYLSRMGEVQMRGDYMVLR